MSPERLTNEVRVLCRELISDYLAQEEPHFDTIWDAYWNSNGCSTLLEHPLDTVWNREHAGVSALGAIGLDDGQHLGTLFLVGAICDVAASVLQRRSEEQVTPRAISMALADSIDRHGTPAYLRAIIERHTPMLLVELLNSEMDKDAKACKKDRGGADVYVQRLLDGKLSDPRLRSRIYACRMPAQTPYDIVVNELDLAIIVEGSDPRKLSRVSRLIRGMIGLAFLNVGRAVSHVEIQDFFGVDIEPESVYRYRNTLAKLLGTELRDRVMSEGVDKKYEIPRAGWSYLWLRRTLDPFKSELLHRVHKRKAE